MKIRMFTIAAAVLLAATATPASAAQLTWYDQCGVIDLWYPQGGFGFDQRWHSEVYPVKVFFTSSYVGPQVIYETCANAVALSQARFASHNHSSRPWDYMLEVCTISLPIIPGTYTLSKIVTYVPKPANTDTLLAYASDCLDQGGSMNWNGQ